MSGPKPDALPLGDIPIKLIRLYTIPRSVKKENPPARKQEGVGGGGWIEMPASRCTKYIRRLAGVVLALESVSSQELGVA